MVDDVTLKELQLLVVISVGVLSSSTPIAEQALCAALRSIPVFLDQRYDQ